MTMAARRPHPTGHVFSTPQSEVAKPHSSNNNSDSVHISTLTRGSMSNSNARGHGRRPYYTQNSYSHSHYHQRQHQYRTRQTHQYHSQTVCLMPPSLPRYFPSRTPGPKRPELSNVVEARNTTGTSSSSSTSSSLSLSSSSSSSAVHSPLGMSSQPTVTYTGLARLPLDGRKPDGIWRGFSGEYTQKDWDIFSKNAQLEERNKRQQSLKPLPPSHSLSTSSSNSNSNSNLVKLDYGGGTANIQLIKAPTEDKNPIGKHISSTPLSSSGTIEFLVETGPAIDQAPPQNVSALEGRLLDLTDQDASNESDLTPSSALTDLLGLEFPVVAQEVILDLLDLDINQANGASDFGSLDDDEGEGDKYKVNLLNGIDSISISDDDGRVKLVSDNNDNNSSSNSNNNTNIKINGYNCDNNDNNNNHICNGSFGGGTTVHQLEATPQVSEDSVKSYPSGTFDAYAYNTDRGLDYDTHEDEDEDDDDDDYDDDDDDDNDDDEDEDDGDDDEMDEVWRQLDHNKVVLTLTTMSRIKDDLEAEKITWSELRMQRL